MNHLQVSQTKETELFFRQWLRSPKSMGAVIPSSRVLARAVTEAIRWRPGQCVVELGAGTGAISQGLIDAGLPPDALMMIELDRPLFEYLRGRFPAVRVVNGKVLPPNGLTVATARPLYVLGDYNELDPAYLNTNNTTFTRPASLVADAITILSDSWSDENSSNAVGSRIASPTTVNAAFLTGVVETTTAQVPVRTASRRSP